LTLDQEGGLMRILRIAGWSLLVLVAAGMLAFVAAAWAYRDIPAERLEARYAGPGSRFMNIDGVRLHYRDEGRADGPVVLLIHANFGNLIGWDPWVAALGDRYRVLRFDLTGHGLTGPDPGNDYSLERTIELTRRFVDALGVQRLVIGGTSLGGTVAIHYTAQNPERVDGLVLLSPGSLYGRDMGRAGVTVPPSADILTWILPRALPAYMLRSRFGDPERVSDELIDQWHSMWLREGNRAAMLARLRTYSGATIAEAAAAVRVPVLIQWGEANPQAPVEQADELAGLLVNATGINVLTYPGIGHMAVEEAGSETGRDLRAWLDGDLAGSAADQVEEEY